MGFAKHTRHQLGSMYVMMGTSRESVGQVCSNRIRYAAISLSLQACQLQRDERQQRSNSTALGHGINQPCLLCLSTQVCC